MCHIAFGDRKGFYASNSKLGASSPSKMPEIIITEFQAEINQEQHIFSLIQQNTLKESNPGFHLVYKSLLKNLIQEVCSIAKSKSLDKKLKRSALFSQCSFTVMGSLFDMYLANHFKTANIKMVNLPCMTIVNQRMFITLC